MRRRRCEGQITILAAMIFGVVLSLIVTTVRSAAFSVGILKADLVTQAGVLNEFSRFFRPLTDQFNVFFLEAMPEMEKEMEEEMYRSLKDDSHFVPVQLSGVFLQQAERATDNGGLGLKENAVRYMNYEVLSDVMRECMGAEYREKSEAVGELAAELEKSTEVLEEADSDVLEMISWLDGVGVKDGRFLTKYDEPVFSGRDFIKKAAPNINQKELGIRDARIYSKTESHCADMGKQMGDLEARVRQNESAYGEYRAILGTIESSRRAGQSFLACVESYMARQEKIKSRAADFGYRLEEKKEVLGQELYDGFFQEGEELKRFATEGNAPFFSVEQMAECVERNMRILQEAQLALNGAEKEEGEKALEMLGTCNSILKDYTLEDMVVDYSGAQFTKENGVLSFFKGLYKRIGTSVFDVITENVKEMSKKSIDVSGLALEYITEQERERAKAGTSLMDRVLFTQYLMTHFACFQDVGIEEEKPYGEEYLDYGLEFVLCGMNGDRENLKAALMGMVKFREGINLMHLFTNYEKKQEAYGFSAAMLGFFGSHSLIKIGQYLLMAAWAYGESIMDVKLLVEGEKVGWYKTAETWQMSLDQLLAFRYEPDAKKAKGTLGYKDVLGILLLMREDGYKYYNAMSAMELRMMKMGYEDFRMRNFLCRIRGRAVFQVFEMNYEKEFDYQY